MAYVKIQTLKPDDYWFQGNDLDSPWVECQVTSGANFLNSNGVYPYTGKWRLPDVIDDIANGVIGHRWAQSLGYTGAPREVHEILSWAINVIAGKVVDTVAYNTPMQQIVYDIIHRRSIILAGTFMPDGHVVCATGVVIDESMYEITNVSQVDLTKVQSILIADPYGNYFSTADNGSRYKAGVSGYECAFPLGLLDSILSKSAPNAYLTHRFAVD